jgi:hypothetical protein
MAILTRDADTDEEVIKIDDVFDTFYTKGEIDNALNGTNDALNDINDALSGKADALGGDVNKVQNAAYADDADHANYTETLHVPGVAWISGKGEDDGVRLYQVDSPNGNAIADNIRVNYANTAGSATNTGSSSYADRLWNHTDYGSGSIRNQWDGSYYRFYGDYGDETNNRTTAVGYADNAGYATNADVANSAIYADRLTGFGVSATQDSYTGSGNLTRDIGYNIQRSGNTLYLSHNYERYNCECNQGCCDGQCGGLC